MRPASSRCSAPTVYLLVVGLTFVVACRVPLAGRGAGQAPTFRPAVVSASPASAQPLVHGLADEMSPVLLAGGRELVYVSNQGGDRNIWLRRLPHGWARRLTSHSADDFDPAVSDSGSELVFVSTRRDAKGDLYLLTLAGSAQPRRLTGAEYGELDPEWFPDGRRLAYVRTSHGASDGIFLLDLGDGSSRRLSLRPGRQPAVSGDGGLLVFVAVADERQPGRPCLWLQRLRDGREWPLGECAAPVGFPSWVRLQGRDWLVYSRFADDSNGDGRLDTGDRPSLWMAPLELPDGQRPRLGRAFPLTTGQAAAIQPRARGRQLVFAARDDGDLDIWSMPLELPATGDCDRAGILAEKAASQRQALWYIRRAGFRAATLRQRQQCRLLEARHLQRWGRHRQAGRLYRALAMQARDEVIRQQALIGQVATAMQQRLPLDLSPARRQEARPVARELLQALDAITIGDIDKSLVRADICRRVGWFTRALHRLDEVVAGGGTAARARALVMQAEILLRLGQPDGAVERLLRVTADQRVQPALRRDAARQMIAAVSNAAGDSSSEQVARLEMLAARTGGRQPAAGMIRLAIARLHRQQGHLRLARQSLRLVEKQSAGQPRLAGEALLQLSRLAEQQGHLAEAADHAAEMLERFAGDARIRLLARRRLERLTLHHARLLAAAGEVIMAAKALEKLLQQEAGDVAAWREWLALMSRSGRSRRAFERVRRWQRQQPDDDALGWYLLGLAYTYLEPPGNFSRAREYLQKSLQLDPQSPYSHQTLGWLEEQAAHHDDDPAHLLAAAEQYEAALELMAGAGSGSGRADLLLNLGNIYLALGNGAQAWRFYQKRRKSGQPFRRPERELLFLENLARAAFLADQLEQSAAAWQQSFALAQRLGRRRRLPRLLAAQAAVWQVAGRHRRAASLFARACRLYRKGGRVSERARCLRALGYNQVVAGADRQAFANLLEAHRLFKSILDEGAGQQPQIAVSLSGRGSRAPLGFSAGQELDLLDTLLARLAARSGDGPRALASLQAKLERLQRRRRRLADERLWLDVSLLQSQLAAGWLDNERPRRAVRLWRESADSARRAGRADGQALAALNLLEVARSGWVRVPRARLVDGLQQALTALQQSPAARPELLARVAAGLAVELARPAGRRAGVAAGPSGPGKRLRLVLAGLDHELVLLNRALEAARLSASQAELVAGVRGARLQAMAAWNLSVLLRRLGRQREADKWYRRVRAELQRPELADLVWRLPGPGTRPAQRLEQLLRVEPKRAVAAGAAARRQRDRLLEQLVAEAAASGDARLVLSRLDTWIQLRRRDRLWPDRDRLRPELAGRLVDRVDTRAVDPGELSRRLPPGWALLDGVSTERETILVWVSSGRGRVLRLPIRRGEISALAAALSGQVEGSAELARRRLGRLLVQPLAALLAQAQGVLLVDGLLDVPWESLPFHSRPLLASVALCRVTAVADVAGWQRVVNVNFGGALWVGARPGAELRAQAAALFGVVNHQDAATAGRSSALSSGLVVWAVDWTADSHRPLRSSLAPHPRLGAVAGLRVDKLGGREGGSGLWVLAPGRRTSSPRRLATGIEVAALQAGVPRVLMVPAGRPGRLLLRGVLQRLGEKTLARALREVVRARGGELSWRDLLRLQLRGHPGLDRQRRLDYARSHLAGAVTAAMDAYQQGRLQRALERFFTLRTLAAYLGRNKILAAADRGIVQCAFRLEKFELARRAQQRLLKVARERSAARAEADASRLLGIITSRLGRHRQARRLLQRARQLFDEQGLPSQAADCAATLALARDAAADYQGAITAARSALERFGKLGNRAQQARMMRLLGTTYLRRLHQLERARRWYREALRRYRLLADESAVDAVSLDLARTELTAGNYDLVLKMAGEVITRSGRRGELARQAEARLEEAKACWYRGDYRRARRAQQQSVQVASRAGDRRLKISAISLGGLILMSLGRLPEAEQQLRRALEESRQAGLADEQAAQLNNLGLVLRRGGRLPEALELHQQARQLDERLKNQAGLAYDLRNAALVLLGLGRTRQAIANLERAVRLSARLHDQFNRAQSLCGLARAEQAAGRLDEGARRARAALQAARQQGLREVVWQAEQILGDLARARNDNQGAWAHYQRAVAVVERLPAGAARAREQGFTIGDRKRLFADAVHLLLELGRPADAFVYAERGRLKDLADSLLRAPGMRDRLVARPVIEVTRLQESIPVGTAMLAFFVTASDTVMWWLDRENLQVKRVQLPAEHLATLVGDLRRTLANYAPSAGYLRRLHRLLLEPWQDRLAGTGNLLVIPHGPLAGVPFAALYEPGRGYLYEHWNVFRCQSASLWQMLRQRREMQQQPPGPALLVNGVPAEQLPFARLELQSISERLPAAALLDRQATRTELLRLAPRAGYIHLIGHGRIEASSPLDRGLSLGGDQRLSLLDVLGMALSARLVVLSGCYTAVAAAEAASSPIDLALAFLLAGAEQSLGSLWPANDAATAVLMKNFYRHLGQLGPARSLRRARDVVRRYFPHPGYWAAYSLVGGP